MITVAKSFDTSKLVLFKPKEVELKEGMTFKRIPIRVMQNSKLLPLLISLQRKSVILAAFKKTKVTNCQSRCSTFVLPKSKRRLLTR